MFAEGLVFLRLASQAPRSGDDLSCICRGGGRGLDGEAPADGHARGMRPGWHTRAHVWLAPGCASRALTPPPPRVPPSFSKTWGRGGTLQSSPDSPRLYCQILPVCLRRCSGRHGQSVEPAADSPPSLSRGHGQLARGHGWHCVSWPQAGGSQLGLVPETPPPLPPSTPVVLA